MFTVPATEQFFLPRLERSLRSVRVGLGWFGRLTPAVAIASRAAGALDPMLSVLAAVRNSAPRARGQRPLVSGRRGDPPAAPTRQPARRTGSLVAADVRGRGGELLAHVELAGPNLYTLTAWLLAWAARALAGLVAGVPAPPAAGALGPVEAFGLDTLQAACAEAGLVEVAGSR